MGATGGSAHGGASPPVNSAGSGCPPGPKARVPPGRRLRNFMLFLCHFPTHDRSPFTRRIRFWYFVSAFPFTSRYWLLHGSPRPCCPVFPLVSFPFLASGYLRLVPHLHDPGSFSSPYACVSLQLLSRSPLRYLQFVRFIRRGLCVHRRSSLFPDFLSDSGSTAPVSGLGFCGPRVAPKRPHTTPPERQRTQGNGWLINISPILEQFTGNRGHWGCFSIAN